MLLVQLQYHKYTLNTTHPKKTVQMPHCWPIVLGAAQCPSHPPPPASLSDLSGYDVSYVCGSYLRYKLERVLAS